MMFIETHLKKNIFSVLQEIVNIFLVRSFSYSIVRYFLSVKGKFLNVIYFNLFLEGHFSGSRTSYIWAPRLTQFRFSILNLLKEHQRSFKLCSGWTSSKLMTSKCEDFIWMHKHLFAAGGDLLHMNHSVHSDSWLMKETSPSSVFTLFGKDLLKESPEGSSALVRTSVQTLNSTFAHLKQVSHLLFGEFCCSFGNQTFHLLFLHLNSRTEPKGYFDPSRVWQAQRGLLSQAFVEFSVCRFVSHLVVVAGIQLVFPVKQTRERQTE